jgi:two-component system chemotaxis response regulator CheB
MILDRVGTLRVRHARIDDVPSPGEVLVAPPDRHLVAQVDGVTLVRGPMENGHRPAVDVLFRSAARAYGARVISVVLSGALDDGAAGTLAVTLRGGVGIAQDFDEALHASMPRAAAAAAGLDLVLPVKEIARTLIGLAGQDVPEVPPASRLMEMESDVADMSIHALTDPARPGLPSGWTCPDCSGSLFEIEEGDFLRFRCRVGHAWSADSLVAQQTASFETALWTALRALEEKVSLALDMGRRARERGHTLTGEQFERHAAEAQRSASIIRALIENLADSGKTGSEVAQSS